MHLVACLKYLQVVSLQSNRMIAKPRLLTIVLALLKVASTMQKTFLYTIINLKYPNQLFGEYRKLSWERATTLCLELNQKAMESGEIPEEWACLYVVGGD